MDHFENMLIKLHALVIFRNILDDPLIKLLFPMLRHDGKSMAERVSDYAAFTSLLFLEGSDLTRYLRERIMLSDNSYIRTYAKGQALDPAMELCLVHELGILEEAATLGSSEFLKTIEYEGYLPRWKTSPAGFIKDYKERLSHIATLGYGIYARYHMFSVKNGEVIPARFPDPIRLSDLKGYEKEQQAVIENTQALLFGKPAANVLLYGDAGTGKSSTVKAIANEFAGSGLRLVEIKKEQLLELPTVMETLHQNPLKFILFIDDLSFSSDEEIGTLKAVLEGTVSARSMNIVLYATSNRRHLIQETFSARGDDDIHANETIQEQASLSDRFGLSVGFFKPGKEKYLDIVHALALQHGIKDVENIDLLAEQHALERGGRSPRVARQFAEYMKRIED